MSIWQPRQWKTCFAQFNLRAMQSRQRKPYSYRDDPSVPSWHGEAGIPGLIVFDGQCVLCSNFVRFVLRHDSAGRFRFTMAQSVLGQALYAHYDLDTVDFETNLVIVHGELHEKLAAVTVVLETLGGPWRAASALRIVPRTIADWLYDRIARNRYRLFGRYDECMVPSPMLRSRIIE